MNLSTTNLKKGHYGWTAKTTVKSINGYDWEITTMKRNSGKLHSTVQGGKSEDKEGYSTLSFIMFQDPRFDLAVSDKRCTEKAVLELHNEGIEAFKLKMQELTDKKEAA